MRSRLAGPYIEKEAKIKDRKGKQIQCSKSPQYYLQARPGLRNLKRPEIFFNNM